MKILIKIQIHNVNHHTQVSFYLYVDLVLRNNSRSDYISTSAPLSDITGAWTYSCCIKHQVTTAASLEIPELNLFDARERATSDQPFTGDSSRWDGQVG